MRVSQSERNLSAALHECHSWKQELASPMPTRASPTPTLAPPAPPRAPAAPTRAPSSPTRPGTPDRATPFAPVPAAPAVRLSIPPRRAPASRAPASAPPRTPLPRPVPVSHQLTSPARAIPIPAARPVARRRVPARVTPIDYSRIVQALPHLQPLLNPLQQYTAQRKAEVSREAAAQQVVINAQSEAKRQTIRSAANNLTQRLVGRFAQARGGISAQITQQRAVVRQSLGQQKGAVRQTVENQARRLGSEGQRLSSSVTQAAQRKTTAAHELGEAQASRATTEVARQAEEARQRGASKAATYRDADPDRAQTQQNAVVQVAEEQAREIEKTAPEMARSAREQANGIATNYIARGSEVANGIQQAVPQTQTAISSLIADGEQQLEFGAQGTLTALGQLEQSSLGTLTDLEAVSLAQVRRMPGEVLPQIEAVRLAAGDQVEEAREATHTQLDLATAKTTLGLVQQQSNPTELRATHARGAVEQQGIVGLGAAALRGMSSGASGQLQNIAGQGLTGLSRIEGQVGGAVARAGQGVRAGSQTLTTRNGEGQQLVIRQTGGRAALLADDALRRFNESATKTITEFEGSFQRGQGGVVAFVGQSLSHNDQMLTRLDANMAAAAARAAAEYDRPWWKKALIALGKGILYLAAGILAIFVLAALIFLAVWALAAIGIGAAISFGTALVIAVVVLAFASVVVESIQRALAYRREHGPVDSFWKALGIATGIVGLSILNLIGVTNIIEGFRGRRFFSDKELSSQERYDLVIGGFLQLATVIFGFTKTGKAVFGKLGDIVGKWVEGLLPKGRAPAPPPETPPVVVPRGRPVLGGETTDFEVLHHYTARDDGGQNPGAWWTQWETTSVKSASRMTGVPEELITIRRSIRVNRNALNTLFPKNESKQIPGEGAALEFQTKAPIDPKFIFQTTPMQRP